MRVTTIGLEEQAWTPSGELRRATWSARAEQRSPKVFSHAERRV